jgi:hypothetical protein
VHDEGFNQPWRLIDAPAMAGEIDAFGALQQRLQRADIVTHMAFRRRDDGGVPAHYMIAGQQRLAVIQRKAQMIWRVAGRVQGFQPPIAARDPLAAFQCAVRREIGVEKRLARLILLDGAP